LSQKVKPTSSPLSPPSDEDGKAENQIQNYERKIDDLMFEVGSLKNQVDLQKALHDIEQGGTLLEAHNTMMEEHAEQLHTICDQLDASSTENRALRINLHQLQEVAEEKKVQCERLSSEKDKLTRKLLEVEMDGQAAGKLVSEMTLAIGKLVEESQLPTSASFARQKDALLSKLSTFQCNNQSLQKMLQEHCHSREDDCVQCGALQSGTLLPDTAHNSELHDNQTLPTGQWNECRTLSDLKTKVEQQQEELSSLKRLHASLEQTRARLMRQLHTKEADCNRMSIQIQTLDSHLSEVMTANQRLKRDLTDVKELAVKEKGYLKKATRMLKVKASRTEEKVEVLKYELLQKETRLTTVHQEMEGCRARLEQVSREKTSALTECSELKREVATLHSKVCQYESSVSPDSVRLAAMLDDKTLENTQLKCEKEDLERRLSGSERTVMELQAKLQHCHDTMQDYKNKADISRTEANNTLELLEQQHKHNSQLQRDGEDELDKVKRRLQLRLQELEPLPEMLKSTELKVHHFEEQLHTAEKKNADNITLIADLTAKLEQLTTTVEDSQHREEQSVTENSRLTQRLESLERKLTESSELNEDLRTTISKRDDTIQKNNVRLEEKTQETISLTQQLENALYDLKQQSNNFHDRVMSKERVSQQKILELESQLSQVKTEINRVRREKNEVDRRSLSKLQDYRDRLEQSESTNRSLQNYVQFLKASYRTVYGDMSIPLRFNTTALP
ncbi:outer dense fiber protein 2-like, partial [Argonauta hians]